MKKVLFTSVALLSLVAGAKVLADDANSYINSNSTPATFSELVGNNAGNLTNPGHNIAKDPESSPDKAVRGYEGREPNHKKDGSVAETYEDTSKDFVLSEKESPVPLASASKEEAMPAKPAAPTMDQKADKADKAAAKMGGEKATAKTLPNTAAVK